MWVVIFLLTAIVSIVMLFDNSIAGWLVGSLDNAGWKKELHMKHVPVKIIL